MLKCICINSAYVLTLKIQFKTWASLLTQNPYTRNLDILQTIPNFTISTLRPRCISKPVNLRNVQFWAAIFRMHDLFPSSPRYIW